MKQLFNQLSMLDRTITRIESWGDVMYIFFHDNTFVEINGGAQYITGDDYGIDFVNIGEEYIDMDTKYSLDIVSEEEYDKWCAEQEKIEEENDRGYKLNKLKKLAEELDVKLSDM